MKKLIFVFCFKPSNKFYEEVSLDKAAANVLFIKNNYVRSDFMVISRSTIYYLFCITINIKKSKQFQNVRVVLQM